MYQDKTQYNDNINIL